MEASDVGRAMNTLPLPKGRSTISDDQFGGVDELYEELERLVLKGKGQTVLARTEGGIERVNISTELKSQTRIILSCRAWPYISC